MKTLFSLFTILCMTAAQAFAQADLPSSIYGAGVDDKGRTLNPASTSSSTSGNTTSSTTGSSGATREGTGRSSGSGASINPGARQGQSSQGSGMGANLMAGAGLIAAAVPMISSSQPPTVAAGAAMMAMALLAIAQGMHQGEAAGQSGQTANSSWDGTGTNGLGDSTGSSVAANPEYSQGAANFAKEQTAKATAALKSAGYSVEKDGLHTPSGAVIPTSAFSSPGAMAAAGIDASAVKAAEKILAGIEKDYAKFNVSGVAVDTGGAGGGGGSHSSNSDYDISSAFAKYKNPFAISDGDKKQIVAGKTVLFDGEPIGVRGRNIFDMIHTAYQTKRTRNDFIEDNGAVRGGGSVPVRAPASVPRAAPKR